MRVINIASGSKGNCTLVETANCAVLIDCGLGIIETTKRLSACGTDVSKISAIFISHTHSDHIKAVEQFARKYKTKIFASDRNWYHSVMQKVQSNLRMIFNEDEEFLYEDLRVLPFVVSHDAPSTVGFRVYAEGKSFSIITDVGYFSEANFQAVAGSDLILIESNHNIEMLMNGPYPRDLKKRVMSSVGHLSNVDCAKQIVRLSKFGTKHFMLMHISETNNTPELAYLETMTVLKNENLDKNIFVGVSFQDKPSTNFVLKPVKEN